MVANTPLAPCSPAAIHLCTTNGFDNKSSLNNIYLLCEHLQFDLTNNDLMNSDLTNNDLPSYLIPPHIILYKFGI
jgi:hypothetical protein